MTTSVIPADSIDALIASLLPGWLKRAPAEHLALLRAALLRQQKAQDDLNARLDAIIPLDAFAESLLKSALATHSITQADVHLDTVKLVTLRPNPPVSPTLPATSTRIETTQTLLSAALHNFHENETQPGWFVTGSHLRKASGQLLPLSAELFVDLCRGWISGGIISATSNRS
ncbi:hypothetical protein GLGCALEP_02399 [Pseudomonas sp. MM221]|nr:hypothetical protein DBADOPDK_02340 [Pseudomonas sp. MM223]CAI3800084.1 hypothetical protein GLGCALEP_02399 [Pseudomonas sp. MM221]